MNIGELKRYKLAFWLGGEPDVPFDVSVGGASAAAAFSSYRTYIHIL